MTDQPDNAGAPERVHRKRAGMRQSHVESGQVSIAVVLTSLAVIGAAFAFTVFAEAVDVRSSTQKGADSAATAAAEQARDQWIETWLRAQKASPKKDPREDIDEDLPEGEKPTDDKDEKDEDKMPVEHFYSPPEPFWAGAAIAAQPAAAAYAQKNDGGILTKYVPSGGNRITVDVFRAKDTKSPQGKKYVPAIAGDSTATAQVVTPPGLFCAPMPNGTWDSWTLECISAKGTATAQYAKNVLVAWDKPAFRKMYTIRLDR